MIVRLAEQLDAETSARGAEQAEEPEPPAPRADGILAGLPADITPRTFKAPMLSL